MKAINPSENRELLVELGERTEPQPAADEALIEVKAFSINRGELFLIQNPRPGLAPGKDVAGVVVAAAANGSGPTVGARVVAHPPMAGWAERVAVKTDSIAEIPDSMPYEIAAALPLAGLTALRLLRVIGPLAGRSILLTGASGGVGHYFVELASRSGASVTAVSRSAETDLLALGARQVVTDVGDATGPFDVIAESVGGPAAAVSLSKLGKRGLFLWFGAVSRQPTPFYFFDFFSGPESATVRHFHYADVDGADGSDLQILVDLTSSGHLHPTIGMTEDWTKTPDLLAAMVSRSLRGKAVGVVSSRPLT